MANNIYPLTFKSGIKKDGTLFQADYCTSGQWIRFQRGYIRKMGGMKGGCRIKTTVKNITNLTLIPSTANNNAELKIYIGTQEENKACIYSFDTNLNFDQLNQDRDALETIDNVTNYTWQTVVINQGQNQKIIFLGAPNLNNINTNAESVIFASPLDNYQKTAFTKSPNLKGATGLLFTNPFLFVYGSNGLVQWSETTDPLKFKEANAINISTDKVIFAAEIRGGDNNPTILFWTLTSVVKCSNKGVENLKFNPTKVSTSSSILSTKCVVEWNGRFFWAGTNKFLYYNGIVDYLPNTQNQNFFFDNLDMNLRQQVFGVKNTKYNEIWWFYPEKEDAPGRNNNIPIGENSRAIIYNVYEESWYDTVLPRSAGTFAEAFGIMVTAGRILSAPENNVLTIWLHEYETFNKQQDAIKENPSLPNFKEPYPILSSFTTPTMSWAAFNPMKQLTGVNRWMQINTLEPDFIRLPANGFVEVSVNTKQYAQDFGSSTPFLRINPPLPQGASPILAKVDMNVQGRHITFTFRSVFNFEMGQVMLNLGIGDGQ